MCCLVFFRICLENFYMVQWWSRLIRALYEIFTKVFMENKLSEVAYHNWNFVIHLGFSGITVVVTTIIITIVVYLYLKCFAYWYRLELIGRAPKLMSCTEPLNASFWHTPTWTPCFVQLLVRCLWRHPRMISFGAGGGKEKAWIIWGDC